MPLYVYIITFHKKNVNLNRYSNSDLQISSLVLYHGAILVLLPVVQLFQEESLKMKWQDNQDSSMVEGQARDLEVRVRSPVQVQVFP